MTDFGVDFKIKEMFFDRVKVEEAVEKAEVKALSKAGAFIRQSAKSSIRNRKTAVSEPGKPPFSHSSDPVQSIKNILFGYDAANHSVVVGPVKLNTKRIKDVYKVSTTIPNVLEFGGSETVTESLPGRKTRTRTINFKARPFMGPALAANADKFPQLFANTVGN